MKNNLVALALAVVALTYVAAVAGGALVLLHFIVKYW
jgi:hypothetical protein